MLDDHLKDGKYDKPCEELHKGTVLYKCNQQHFRTKLQYDAMIIKKN